MKKIVFVNEEALEQRLKDHLERRELPDAFLYTGTHGAANWLALESSKRFPIAATLTALMKKHARSLVRRIGGCRGLVSIGAGDAQKELLLLRAMPRLARPACHVIDVSSHMVDAALQNLDGLGLQNTGIVAFCEDLDHLAPYWDHPILLCLLGNNFCNYEPSTLLPLLGRNLGPADRFLLDGNLLPDSARDVARWRQEVEEIYNAPENVRFNIAPLVARGLDPESCRFELKLVCVESPWGRTYRTQKRIHIHRRAVVQCGTGAVAFAAGEIIEMGFTYKYRLDQLRGHLEEHGFGVAESWTDYAGGNIILLATQRTAETAS